MKINKIRVLIYCLVFLLAVSILAFFVYQGSIPKRYALSVDDISDSDILTPRDIVDEVETAKKAEQVRIHVTENGVTMRSKEISDNGSDTVSEFFSRVSNIRDEARSNVAGSSGYSSERAGQLICEMARSEFSMELPPEAGKALASAMDSSFKTTASNCIAAANMILMEEVDLSELEDEIASISEQWSNNVLANGSTTTMQDVVKIILDSLLEPNSVPDETATLAEVERAIANVNNDPVMIEKGAKIVSAGQKITQEDFEILQRLNLIETSGLNNQYFFRLFAYVALILLCELFYLFSIKLEILKNLRLIVALGAALFVTVFSSIYLTSITPLLIPVYFSAVIFATYLESNTGFILSVGQILILFPVSKFDLEFMFISILGCFICCVISGERKRNYSSALLILMTGGTCFFSSVVYNLIDSASLTKMLTSSIWATIAGMVSVILATGFIPIFELISNSISPIRLIEISQPGTPLQKRLFMEAPGTYQHSMMVANLADSAAASIGANALLAKAGAFYHDIGKLENPLYFTENQSGGENPHDRLSAEESCAIILAHPENGVRIARKNRLPVGVISFIQEHHGTTFQPFFFHKAKEDALARGEPEPPVGKFRYKGPLPLSRESAIVMLADTCEAAIKSTGIRDLAGAQELFRKLIKQKIDQDQLIHSGLSFTDIEMIIRSFLQVYSGVFHERIKYPDDTSNR